MLDSDIAYLFDTNVSLLNRQMRRNIGRFPEDFCFRLTDDEIRNLRCQNGATKLLSSKRRYAPYVYTEHGIEHGIEHDTDESGNEKELSDEEKLIEAIQKNPGITTTEMMKLLNKDS